MKHTAVIYNLTTPCLNGTLSCVHFMDVAMGDIPVGGEGPQCDRLYLSNNLWKGFNMFMCNFGHVYSFVKCKLFKQYCCSFYGAPLWILDSNSIS